MKTNLSILIVAGFWVVSALDAGILPNPTITLAAPPFGPTFVAANVFDSKEAEYASQSLGFGPSLSTTQGTFLEFDFGAAVTIDRFIDVTRRNALDVVNTERLIFSNDPIFDSSDPVQDFTPAGSDGNGFIKSFAPRTARYVRWEVLDGALNGALNTRNFGSTEMRFLSPTTGSIQLAPTVIGGATPFNPSFDLPNAVNGDAGRSGAAGIEYASLGMGANMFVDFDMGATRSINGFDFYDRFGTDPGGNLVDKINSFDLLFSDNPTFASGVTTRSFTPGDWGFAQQFAPVNARYVRFDATSVVSPTNNSGIQEITFYATPEPTVGLMLICGSAVFARRRPWLKSERKARYRNGDEADVRPSMESMLVGLQPR